MTLLRRNATLSYTLQNYKNFLQDNAKIFDTVLGSAVIKLYTVAQPCIHH